MTAPGLVLDSAAVLAYGQGDLSVGRQIADRADADQAVLVPVLCVAEAYRRATNENIDLLELLQWVRNVVVTPVEPDMAPFLGGFSRTLGSVDLAQVVITAAQHPTVPVMTSERDLVTQVLPKEWPIIDL